MTTFSRKIIYVLAALIAIFGIVRIYHISTDDFRLTHITHTIPTQPAWVITPPTPAEEQQLQHILAQPFHYLGKGSQSYAFASEDGKYVLKFFKFKHLRPNLFFQWAYSLGLFKRYHERQSARKERKIWGVFNSYKLAYDKDRQASGLIFIQLNPDNNPSRIVDIRNKLGLSQHLDLQHYTFVLQVKGEALADVLDKLLKQGNVALAQDRITAVFDLYASEYRKGIYDQDHAVMRNIGFVDNQPIHLDVGKLVENREMQNKERAKADAQIIASKMQQWIKQNYPQYLDKLYQGIEQKIQQLYE